MTVFVDDMYRYRIGRFRGMKMSHMIADTDAELHRFALMIGMPRERYQGDHYDVPESMRDRAIAAGAVAITYKQAGAMRRRKVVEGICGRPEDAKAWYHNWLRTAE
jgi:hypothetical protein